MLIYEKNSLEAEIAGLVETYGKEREALLPILEAIQKKYNYISDFAQQEVAKHLQIHPVEVYSVISFYAFLNHDPKGRNIVRLCQTISCTLSGKARVAEAIEKELGIKFGETTRDRRISLEYTSCLGMCDMGPSMLVNDTVYNKLDPQKAVKILSEVK